MTQPDGFGSSHIRELLEFFAQPIGRRQHDVARVVEIPIAVHHSFQSVRLRSGIYRLAQIGGR